MTFILALDSSTDACSVALYADGRLSALFELAAKSHTQRLLPMVDEVLRTNHWKEAVQIYVVGGKIQIAPLPKQN